MNNKLVTVTFAALLFGTTHAFAAAADAKVTIHSPENGATVGQNMTIEFDAIKGSEGDHLHLYVDGKRVDVIHELKGTTKVALTPGKHRVCMEVNTTGHVAVSPQACVEVTAK